MNSICYLSLSAHVARMVFVGACDAYRATRSSEAWTTRSYARAVLDLTEVRYARAYDATLRARPTPRAHVFAGRAQVRHADAVRAHAHVVCDRLAREMEDSRAMGRAVLAHATRRVS